MVADKTCTFKLLIVIGAILGAILAFLEKDYLLGAFNDFGFEM